MSTTPIPDDAEAPAEDDTERLEDATDTGAPADVVTPTTKQLSPFVRARLATRRTMPGGYRIG